jgi:hypothetical protein
MGYILLLLIPESPAPSFREVNTQPREAIHYALRKIGSAPYPFSLPGFPEMGYFSPGDIPSMKFIPSKRDWRGGLVRDLKLKNFALRYDILVLNGQATSIRIFLRLPLRTGFLPDRLLPDR